MSVNLRRALSQEYLKSKSDTYDLALTVSVVIQLPHMSFVNFTYTDHNCYIQTTNYRLVNRRTVQILF